MLPPASIYEFDGVQFMAVDEVSPKVVFVAAAVHPFTQPDVGRLEIAVEEATRVGVSEGAQQMAEELARLRLREGPPHSPLREAPPPCRGVVRG